MRGAFTQYFKLLFSWEKFTAHHTNLKIAGLVKKKWTIWGTFGPKFRPNPPQFRPNRIGQQNAPGPLKLLGLREKKLAKTPILFCQTTKNLNKGFTRYFTTTAVVLPCGITRASCSIDSKGLKFSD
jgi:hypothetical protein